MTIELEEGQRQAILLALAKLSLSRPGWHPACLTPIAELLGGKEMYEQFRSRGPDLLPLPDFSQLDAEEADRQLEILLAQIAVHTEGEQQRLAAALVGAAQGCAQPIAKYAVHILACAVGAGPESLAYCARYLRQFIEIEKALHADAHAITNS